MYRRDAIPPAALEKILQGPAAVPPLGVKPNFDHARNAGSQRHVLALTIICIIVVTAATFARLYSRLRIQKRLHIEDYLGFAAFFPFFGIVWCILNLRNHPGFFVHQWDIRGADLVQYGINTIVVSISYGSVMLLLKTAILLEWMRIFALNQTNTAFFRASAVLIALNVCTWVSCIFVLSFACVPPEKSWHFWVDGKCQKKAPRDGFFATFNLLIDIFIFLLPQRMIWNLQTSRGRKAGISIVFSVGLLVIGLAAGRLYSTLTMHITDPHKATDRTYHYSHVILWAFGETTSIFMVFCVPALPRLFQDVVIARLRSSSRSWSRFGGKESKEPKEKSWPRTIGSASLKPRGVKRGHRLTEDEEGTIGSLTELADVHHVYDKPTGEQNGNPYIMKTAKVEQHEDEQGHTSVERLQHPWTAA